MTEGSGRSGSATKPPSSSSAIIHMLPMMHHVEFASGYP